jgi:chloride channel protein, CIC family
MATRRAGTGARHCAALAALAVITGGVVAVGIRIFKWMIAGAEWLAHGWLSDSWMGVGLPWLILIPVAGGLLVGAILHLASIPEEPGHGVAEVIETVTLGTEDFPERRTPLKATVAALSLGAGASLGPEDPAVEIGGSIGHVAGRKAGLSQDSIQAFVAVGGASGLAAAFHAPLAAMAFAVEVFALRPLSRTMGLVVAGVVSAYLLTRVMAPTATPSVPAYAGPGGWELALCVGLAALGGVLSAGQIRLMYSLEFAVIGWRAVPRWLKPALGGLVIGLVGLLLPELLGIGYGTLERILAGADFTFAFLLTLAIVKMVLMTVSFGTGFLGGFFAPSLFIGAALGGAWGTLAADLLPALELSPSRFAAAGMVAVLAGSVRAPLSAVLLILALSGSYAIAPLLVVAAVVGYATSRGLERHSLYTYGISHPEGKGPGSDDETIGVAGPDGPQSDVDDDVGIPD